MIEGIRAATNMSKDIDIIRFCLKNTLEHISTPELIKTTSGSVVAKRKYSDEEAQEMVSKKRSLDLCPVHSGSFLSTCGCKDNGKLLEYYKGIME